MEKQASNSREHILACISSSPSSAKIIKAAAQMARAFGADLTALYIKTRDTDHIGREARERLSQNISLAASLGADIATVEGVDIPYQIAEFAHASHATKIVIGRSHIGSRCLFGRQSLADKLIKSAPMMDVYVIPDADAVRDRPDIRSFAGIRWPRLHALGLTAFILMMATVIGFLFLDLNFTEANIITIYLLGALFIALLTKNYICSTVSSFVSVLAFGFFFTEPRFSFRAYETEDVITFAIMLTASLMTGVLANQLARAARQSADNAYRTKLMLDTDRRLREAESERIMLGIVSEQLTKLLSRNMIVYPVEDGRLGEGLLYSARGDDSARHLATPQEQTLARLALSSGHRVGVGTDTMNDALGLYIPVVGKSRTYTVIGIQVGARPIEPFETGLMMSILGEFALAAESLQNAREREQIAQQAENEKLRSNLLRSISHDLRTPLTSISGNAENLLTNFERIDADSRRQLLTDVYDDSLWLIGLVENLLSITRISEGRMNLNLSAELADEVIAAAVNQAERRAGGHTLIVEPTEGLLLARMDAGLISQVIINLIDNAVKYTPEGSTVRISAAQSRNDIVFEIRDNGPGIPDRQKERVFEMFYTGEHSVSDCRRSLGLGLALCRSIIEAHGGKITLSDNRPHGCVFSFTLPKSEVALNE